MRWCCSIQKERFLSGERILILPSAGDSPKGGGNHYQRQRQPVLPHPQMKARRAAREE
jgi:hypothetical protein